LLSHEPTIRLLSSGVKINEDKASLQTAILRNDFLSSREYIFKLVSYSCVITGYFRIISAYIRHAVQCFVIG